jgi:ADP-ribose pyrophosphatase
MRELLSIYQIDYLHQLPKNAQYIGDHKNNEIEIIEDQEQISDIIEKRWQRIENSNLSDKIMEGNELGIVFEDEYIIVVRDPVIFPIGKTGTYLRIFERSSIDGPAGVVILPFRDGLIYLRRIFRHALRQWELECPRGFRPKGLSPSEIARREISEEIGIEIKSIQEIGTINPNSGLLVGAAQAYWVILEPGESNPNPEEGEAFGDIIPLTVDQLMEKIRDGEIRDGYTLSALQLAQAQGFLHLK